MAVEKTINFRPCFTEVQVVHYNTERYCASWFFFVCLKYRYRTRAYYSLEKRCCHGYTGNLCTTPICSCQNGGTCVAPNICRCSSEYEGNSCQTPRCYPSCHHGHCVSPNRCSCNTGYTGSTCSQPVCNPPCHYGGVCIGVNSCRCPSNQAGPYCRQPLCNPACLNGGSCTYGHTCDCSGTHYTGIKCETPVCNPPCQSGGTCVSPNTCQCPSSHAGPHCNQPLCNPACLNGGVCTSSHTCNCSDTQYTGARCEIPVCNPACRNGGSCVAPNKCVCTEQHTGTTCNIPVCSPECANGGVCTQQHVCNCSETLYTGTTCETPVCDPACRNGGACVSPNRCYCTETYTGASCEIPMCAHHHPCFPGECNNMIHCRCTYGFSGEGGLERCKTFDANNIPVITKCMSVLSNIERTGKKRELYKYITDSSEPNSTKVDMLWLNQKDYNYINADFTAMYVPPDGIAPPIYVTDFAFGIVGAYLRIDLYKVHRNSSDKAFVSLNSTTYPCPNQPGSNNPNEAVYSCNVTHHDFDRLLENGDK
ncbi:von Willebrand factor D and EGF domain-containing protein-like [Saccostrea cucullata]|uniref:von Willebrand factor D and EGF domain-containing protein-like n=1 Tax=Saccostrea cuccullata TaxID=36930 RepID=UPI002ED20374